MLSILTTLVLQIGTHFLLTFLFHFLSATSKPLSSLSTRLAHAVRLGFFYKNALYKFTVIIISTVVSLMTLNNFKGYSAFRSYYIGI